MPTSLADAGWAEIMDGDGSALGRCRVMLAFPGSAPASGEPALACEQRSVRLTTGAPSLVPGRYRVRFEARRDTRGVEVTASPAGGDAEVATIRWDDPDLPASLVERGEH